MPEDKKPAPAKAKKAPTTTTPAAPVAKVAEKKVKRQRISNPATPGR